jgi:hypothetical protein
MVLLVLVGTLLAAGGQVLVEIGATGRDDISAFPNGCLLSDAVACAVGALM